MLPAFQPPGRVCFCAGGHQFVLWFSLARRHQLSCFRPSALVATNSRASTLVTPKLSSFFARHPQSSCFDARSHYATFVPRRSQRACFDARSHHLSCLGARHACTRPLAATNPRALRLVDSTCRAPALTATNYRTSAPAILYWFRFYPIQQCQETRRAIYPEETRRTTV